MDAALVLARTRRQRDDWQAKAHDRVWQFGLDEARRRLQVAVDGVQDLRVQAAP